jgi:hypothetical protein
MLRESARAAKPAASRAAITGMFPGATGLSQKPAKT